MSTPIRRRIVAAGFAAAAVIAGVTTGTGTAAGETKVPLTQPCFSLSPYILDQPYVQTSVTVDQRVSGSVVVTLGTASSFWFLAGGYNTDIRLDWHNTDTGARGTENTSIRSTVPAGTATFFLGTGPGRVEFTFRAVNSLPLWSIPTNTCRGVIDVW